ncbi:hypothetical protein CAPTEDRAFT_128665, partial [Capitella teleta]
MSELERFAALLKEMTGIVVRTDTPERIESRIKPLLKDHPHMDIGALVGFMRSNPKSALSRAVCEAMTVNESYFFRDKTPFSIFEEIMLPELAHNSKRSLQKKIRIWCAAASTGQEPYSLGITWLENKNKYSDWSLDVFASDLSEEALDRARLGQYNQFEVQRGLPINILVKYFTQEGANWKINAEVKEMIRFEQHNLLQSASMLGEQDIIFCRNVLIYFDVETKRKILDMLKSKLAPDGFLVLGSSE